MRATHLREVNRHPRSLAAFFTSSLLFLPGCVVQAMHDDLAATNKGVQKLAELAPELQRTNAAIDRSNAQLERLYAELAETHKSLNVVIARMDSTNSHLQESVRELRRLEPMSASLKNLDESLASLRKSIENIDRVIPLLNISEGTPSADRALRRQAEERKEQAAPTGEEPR